MFWILRLTFSLFYVHGLSEILLKLEFSKAFQVTLLYHGLYFALGAAFFKRDWHWAPIFLIGAFIELHFRAQQFSQYSPATPMVVWVSSIAFILFSININNLIHNKTPWLAIIARRLGMLTYPLYLIHNEIGVFVEKKGSSFGLDDRTAFAVSFVGVILLGSAIAFAYEQKMQIVFKKALGALLKRVQDVRNARARAA
ncbi:hypothetical protein SAMN05880590_11068 [Rhizobium sp. RU35A]|nr:hypothetical protein SAMN05880590_11068 [Rhizobium sp. RU35A]